MWATPEPVPSVAVSVTVAVPLYEASALDDVTGAFVSTGGATGLTLACPMPVEVKGPFTAYIV